MQRCATHPVRFLQSYPGLDRATEVAESSEGGHEELVGTGFIGVLSSKANEMEEICSFLKVSGLQTHDGSCQMVSAAQVGLCVVNSLWRYSGEYASGSPSSLSV